VLYHHAHGHRPHIGKDELVAGRPMLREPPYAAVLAQRGFAALAIDHRGFGERAAVPERMQVKRGLWEGVPLWGRRVADAIAASAWIRSRDGMQTLPLAALGFSMGGSLAWWSAALDTRIDAIVDACCLAEFGVLLESAAFDLHAEYYFVPGLLREFTAAAINALILPRPHLSLVGHDDPLTPPAGVAAVDVAMRAAAGRAGMPDAWRQSVHAAGHEETPGMRAEILAFLDERLR
jgi:dienelactone hydrolase